MSKTTSFGIGALIGAAAVIAYNKFVPKDNVVNKWVSDKIRDLKKKIEEAANKAEEKVEEIKEDVKNTIVEEPEQAETK